MAGRDTVLVTGGVDGLGRAIARACLEAGWQVHVCDLNAVAVSNFVAEHPSISATVADVGRGDDVRRLFREAQTRLGPIGALINNVGIGGPSAAIEMISLADWEECLRVNVTGTFLCMQAAVEQMKKAGGGSIINISSASTRTRLPLRTPYIASKFAVEGMTLNAARELGPYGIRCNALLPGVLNNARMDGIVARRAEAEGRTAREVERDLLSMISLRARTELEEVAAMALFLASVAGARVTGELIAVSGNLEWEI